MSTAPDGIPPPTWSPRHLPLFHPWRRSGRAYKQLRAFLNVYLRTLHHLEVKDAHRVPLEGPILLAGNHPSMYDPPCLLAAAPRRVACLSAEWTFSYPVLRRIMRGTGMIFVDREKGGATALRKAVKMLEQGWAIGIYPHGKLVQDTEGDAVKAGLVQIATLSGARIVPVRTFGTDLALPAATVRPHLGKPVRITFGDPFALDLARADLRDADKVAAASAAVMERIYSLT